MASNTSHERCYTFLGKNVEYSTALPFPHLVVDAFLTPETIHSLNKEWPGEWLVKEGRTSVKKSLQKNLPSSASQLVETLYSEQSCKMIGNALGVKNLLPDPYWHSKGEIFGGGLHDIPSGGFLKMHVDFNMHPTGLQRCANLLIYLNETWKKEWGGELVLGDKKKVMPIAGRAVLFGTTEDSWHGHPEPLNTPKGISRRSLALYYYTEAKVVAPHTTIYRSKK